MNIINNRNINDNNKLGLIYTKLVKIIDPENKLKNNKDYSLRFKGLSVKNKIEKLLELYNNKINKSIKNKITNFIEKIKSKVDVYIYEVKGPNKNSRYSSHLNQRFYFKKLSIKKNTNSKNSLIIPNKSAYNYITSITSNQKKIFSQNIIKNKNSNKNKELNMNINDISFLYRIYKEYAIRNTSMSICNNKSVKKQIYDNIHLLLNENIKILTDFYELNNFKINLKNKEKSNFLSNTSEIIYNLKDDGKIIIFGDNHGSFHSFFRIIVRFYITGIISNNYKLKDDYKIILLGDIIDRGVYCIELLYIILKLMTSNNTDNELKVIIIRGNHEELNTFKKYGFKNEVEKKIKKSLSFFEAIDKKSLSFFEAILNNPISKFNNFFKLCPSAIILEHLYTRYWLAHGGFNINNISLYKDNLKNKIFMIDNSKSSQIRWNDFDVKNESECSEIRGGCSRDFESYNIGLDHLYIFLNELKINFIIRGHTDNISNAMLLNLNKNQPDNIFFKLNEKKNYDKIKKIKQNIIKYCNIDTNTNTNTNTKTKTKKCNDKIVSIIPLNFKNQKIGSNTKKLINLKNYSNFPMMNNLNNEIIFPVLTISNNSDKDRDLYSDSYVIIN
jgi:hypothetical protein